MSGYLRNCKKHIISIIWHVRQNTLIQIVAAVRNEKRHMFCAKLRKKRMWHLEKMSKDISKTKAIC